MSVLVIAEHDHASVKGATLNAVTAAAACGGDVHVLVAGHHAGAAAAAAAQIAGEAKVLHADGADLADQLAEAVATQVVSADTFERPIYAGNAIATVQSADAVKVITVRTTGFDAAGHGGSAVVESVAAVAGSGKSRFVGREIAKSDRPELTAAKIIVSGGRAMGSSEKFNEVLTPLADKLGAALGASRAAVDAGYAPNDWQVGQTG